MAEAGLGLSVVAAPHPAVVVGDTDLDPYVVFEFLGLTNLLC